MDWTHFECESIGRLRDGRTTVLRRVEPDDGDAIQRFVRSLSPYSRYQRWMVGLLELPASMLEQIVHGDAGREAAVLAQAGSGIVGLAQFAAEDGAAHGEVALVVAEDWRHAGLATHLLYRLGHEARSLGFRHVYADILRGNGAAIALARRFDVELGPSPEGIWLTRVRADLAHAAVTSH
jgi:acetyltransferase